MSTNIKISFPLFMRNSSSLLKLLACLICLGVIYFPIFKSMINDWIHLPGFSHGFFVPLISLLFILRRIYKLDNQPVCPQTYGVFVLLIGLLTLLAGNFASENFAMRLSFPIVLTGIVLFLLGYSHFKILLFPISYLIFMIPIPSILLGKITFPMQLFASKIATFLLYLFDIPVLREGNIIILSNTTLEVVAACSGIRSLVSLLSLGTLFAYLTKRFFWQRAVLIFLCFPIAIIMNSIRVGITGVLASYYGVTVAEGFFHNFSGYIIFVLALSILAVIGFILSKLNPSADKI